MKAPGRLPGPRRAGRLAAAILGLAALAAAEPAGTPVPAGSKARLEVAADRTSLTVGDPVTVTCRLTYPEGTRIEAFHPERDLGDLTLLDRTAAPPRRLDAGGMEEDLILKVTAYKPGPVQIPALTVATIDAKGEKGSAVSAPISLRVASVLGPQDTSPADIKPQAWLPERRLWPFVLLGLALLAGEAWILSRRRARRPRETVTAPAMPSRPAHEVAYAELERLMSSGLLEKGRIKEFYVELAEIIRRYLAAHFGVETFERTTAEILEALRLARVPAKVTSSAGEFLSACDLVKFAKFVPTTEETRRTFEMAYRLVDETRPAPATSEAGRVATAAVGGGRR